MERAGGIGLVSLTTIHTGVQQTNVEKVSKGGWISGRQIPGHNSGGESLTMNRDPEFLQDLRLRFFRGQHGHILGQAEIFGELTCGVMVPGNDENLGADFPQLAHLGGKEEASVVVFPVSII